MTINEAIKKAIKGGYDYEAKRDYMAGGSAAKALVLIDPEFWKALTIEMNKDKAIPWEKVCEDCGTTTLDCEDRMSGRGAFTIELWRYEMRQFIDCLAEGKTAEWFFKQLSY